MISKSLIITILITALSYGSGLDQARSESFPEQVQRVDNQVKEIEKTLEKLQQQVKEPLNEELPIGTIIPSILNPIQFFAQLEDSEKSKWVLADGVNVRNSKYASVVGMKVPDLRGIFLRGMNYEGGNDPDPNRKAGESQQDALQQHHHATNAKTWNWDGKTSEPGYRSGGKADPVPAQVTNVTNVKPAMKGEEVNVAIETRPKNVAVYFYIKIN